MCRQTTAPTRKLYSRKGSEVQFPGKLHDMMAFVERENLESIISWVDEGRAIMINDPEKLVQILPLFFGQTKYRSFRRQLNMWRFERTCEGPLKGAFSHPYFLQGQKKLVSKMSRHLTNDIAPSALITKKLSDEKNQQFEQETSTSFSLPTMSTLPCHKQDDVFDINSSGGDFLDTAMSAVDSIIEQTSSSSYTCDSLLSQNNDFNDGDLVSFAGRQFHFLDFKSVSRGYKNKASYQQTLVEPQQLWSHDIRTTVAC